MVDTMDPVSIKQGTGIPPMQTSKCGQDDIKLDIVSASIRPLEPEGSPPELWLRSSGGSSFPPACGGMMTLPHPKKDAMQREVEDKAIEPHMPGRNGQAAGTSYKSPDHSVMAGKADYAD